MWCANIPVLCRIHLPIVGKIWPGWKFRCSLQLSLSTSCTHKDFKECVTDMISQTTKPPPESLTKATKWSSSPDTYTADELIDAWEKGRQNGFVRGQGAMRRAMESLLQTNLAKAFQLSEEIFSEINDAGADCRSIFLRIDDVDQFSVLFFIAEDDIGSDSINEVYAIASDLEQRTNTAEFAYELMLVPFGENTNFAKIEADGYRFSYPATRD